MREIRPEDYEKLAQNIVDDFIGNDTPLIQGVSKVASSMELNPHEIRNLTQLSNVAAHLRLFEKKAGNKMVEFLPVDPRDVIQGMFKDVPTEKTASDDSYSRESDFYGDFGTKVLEITSEKLATDAPEQKRTSKPIHRSDMIQRLRKVAEELDSRRLQSAWEYTEEIDKLASEFAKLYGPELGPFEKNAVARYGNVAVPILNDIRSRLRMPKVSLAAAQSNTKVAHVIDDDTPVMRSLLQLIKSATDTNDCARGLSFLKEKVGGML